MALAGILAMKPENLLLDEPSGGLDPGGRRMVINILKKLDIPKIIASHDIELLMELSDNAIILNKGKVAIGGNVKDILTDVDILRKNGLEEPAIVRIHGREAYDLLDQSRSQSDGSS